VNKKSGHRTRRAALAILVIPAAIALGAASATAAAAAPASARHHGTGPVITGLRTVETFNFEAGGQPENVTINPDGSLTVSLLGFLTGQPPQLLHISRSRQVTILVTGEPREAIGGNARDSQGTIYYNLLSGDPARSGIWRLRSGGSPERIGALPAGQFLNGLTINAAGKTLYAADSLAGAIWTVPTSGGPVTAWLASPALAPLEPGPGHFGANGVTYHNGAVWASNTDRQTLLRIPVTATGAPGPVQVIARNLTGIDDFKFLSDHSDVAFVALNSANEVAAVFPDGRTKIAATVTDGLDSPTDTAVRGSQIYITDGGDNPPHNAQLQTGKINFAALFGN
jgi:hypothetical protein